MNSLFPRVAAALAAALLTVSCGGAPADDPPLAGARIGGPFTLIDQDGRTVRDSDFAGRYRLVYFGYTYCPDVCPNDMQKLGKLMRALDAGDPTLAAKLVPVFITVDPERDKPAEVKQFVSAFHPRIVGLTGSPSAIAAVAKNYAIYYKKMPPTPQGGYLVDHIAMTYLMGPEGEPIAGLSRDMSEDEMLAVIRRWVK